jgi:hypothetical protein
MMATRNSTWFLVIAGPIIARYMPQVEYCGLFRKRGHGPGLSGEKVVPARKESPIVNYAILIGLLTLLVIQSPWFQADRLLDPDTPVAAMDFIEKHPLKGNLYHTQAYGDYLIWRVWPKQRSFFDGRVHLFDKSFVKSYQQILIDSHWEELLEKYQIRYLLLPKGSGESAETRMVNKARHSPSWRPLYEDSLSVLFEKLH